MDRIVEIERLELDESEQSGLRPLDFGSYIGQEKIKSNLAVSIEAAKMRGEALDHTLFYGPPGLGKTTLAHIIASGYVEETLHLHVQQASAHSHSGGDVGYREFLIVHVAVDDLIDFAYKFAVDVGDLYFGVIYLVGVVSLHQAFTQPHTVAHDVVHLQLQNLGVERLLHIGIGTAFITLHHVLDIVLGGE